jgi:peptidyl-prolyl cis-trans isomerase C
MKYAVAITLACALALAGCGQKGESPALREGTPAHALAQDLAAVVPALGPDQKTVLVETKDFVVTAADVIRSARDLMGTRAEELKTRDAGQLKQVIDNAATSIAERRLLLAAAAAAKTDVTAEELEQAMQSEYSRAGGEQAFLEALEGVGISVENVKKSIRESLVINKLLAGVVESGAAVSEADLRRAYEEESAGDKTASVRHILIMTQGKSDEEKAAARTKIEDILTQAKAGADFAELARLHSEDPGSKENGGLYQDFSRGQMVKPFEDAAFTIPVGEISGVVETEYGYHILKIVDRKKETRSFDEVRAELESRLQQGKQGSVVEDYIKGLKDKAGFKLIGL